MGHSLSARGTNSLARMPHQELDFRLCLPAGVLALQEVAEKFLLERDAVIGVKTP